MNSIVIRKERKQPAALVDAKRLARLRRGRERFDVLRKRIAERYADLPEKEGIAEIDAAIRRERERGNMLL